MKRLLFLTLVLAATAVSAGHEAAHSAIQGCEAAYANDMAALQQCQNDLAECQARMKSASGDELRSLTAQANDLAARNNQLAQGMPTHHQRLSDTMVSHGEQPGVEIVNEGGVFGAKEHRAKPVSVKQAARQAGAVVTAPVAALAG